MCQWTSMHNTKNPESEASKWNLAFIEFIYQCYTYCDLKTILYKKAMNSRASLFQYQEPYRWCTVYYLLHFFY